MNQELEILWNLLAALGIGLLIGIERGWYGREEDEGDRIAGIRTFSLTGLLGGIWAVMSPLINPWILVVVFLSLAALVVASYVVEKDVKGKSDIGITTEIALLLTFSLGAWAAFGYHALALGTAVVVTTLLSLKPVLHYWLTKIEVKEIYAGIKLLIISVILLPLLPDKGYGPGESLNPYWIWWMVVLISGLSFLGYISIKYKGEQLGTMLTAFTGGLASSTAVTLSLAQFASKFKRKSSHLFIAGVLVAASIMFVRVGIEVVIVNPDLLHPLWIPLTVMLLLTFGSGIYLWNKYRRLNANDTPIEIKNPLQLSTALKFGFLLALILLLATAMEDWFGDEGIYLLSLISGLMDVDAITLSLARMAMNEISPVVATLGIMISVITNTLVKAGLFIFWVGFKKSASLIWAVVLISIAGILSLLPFL